MDRISPMLYSRIEQQQAINNLTQNNSNTQYVDLSQKPDTFEYSTKKEDKNKKGKILKIIAIGTAIAAATAGIIYAVKKGKSIKLDTMTPDKFKQIQTDKFTGKIKGNLKNGDKIVMEYVDGVLKKSTRKGNVNFEKVYETINNEKIIKTTTNGVTTRINLTKRQQEVKEAQEKLKSILKDNLLSSDELKKQTDTIKYKSNNQKKEIENVINSKKKIETDLKAKAEKEAQEKALKEAQAKAEKEAQEKALKEAQAKAEKELQIKQQIDNFKDSILNKTDDEIEQMFNQTRQEHNELYRKAKKLAKENGIHSEKECDILKNLSKNEIQEYELLENKIAILSNEQTIRKRNYLEGILCKQEDKPLKSLDSKNYATNDEMEQLLMYYDDYQCNSAYRGQGGNININEKLMDNLFKKAPALEEDAMVYRSVSACKSRDQKFIDSFKKGIIIDNPGYTSTATKVNDKQFYQFAGSVVSKDNDGVLMRIHLPKGTKGVLGGYNEYLLPRNSKIKINKMHLIDGIKIADCEYILP